MPERIRPISHDDLPALEKLYDSRKTIAELQWVLQNPYKQDELDGFLVENENGEILGMIGYEVGCYKYQSKMISGAIFMSWKISDGYKGFAGIRLVSNVLAKGDFGLAIQGSDIAQNIYASLGLKSVGLSAFTFIKVNRPIAYFRSLKGRTLAKRLGNLMIVLPSFFKSYKSKLNNLSFRIIEKDEIQYDVPHRNLDFFEKEITKEYLKWLVSCPHHSSFIFEIRKEKEFLGYSVCYIQKEFFKAPRARIVYMPNMGVSDDDWSELLSFHVSFLKERKCCSISVLCSQSLLKSKLIKHGFVNYKSKQKPIFVRDPKKQFEGIPVQSWYMQYTESDKAYRVM